MHTDTATTTPAGGADELARIREQVEGLQARIDQLEAERAGPPVGDVAPADPTPGAAEPLRLGRRRAIAGLAGAAAAGTAVALASASPAAAANGQALTVGVTNNTATAPTLLAVPGNVTGPYGLAVAETGVSGVSTTRRAGLLGVARGGSFHTALRGVGVGTSNTGSRVDGVTGESTGGIGGRFTSTALDQPAVIAVNTNHLGVTAGGKLGQVRLVPSLPVPSALPEARMGALYMQAPSDLDETVDGTLWACVRGGTTGTWRKLAGHDTAGALHILPVPQRAYDSRSSQMLSGGVARTVDLSANGGVPRGATGAIVTVLLVGAATGNGNLTIWANGRDKPPAANTLVWGGNAKRFTTQTLTAVDAQARVRVEANLQTHVVLDVVGYHL